MINFIQKQNLKCEARSKKIFIFLICEKFQRENWMKKIWRPRTKTRSWTKLLSKYWKNNFLSSFVGETCLGTKNNDDRGKIMKSRFPEHYRNYDTQDDILSMDDYRGGTVVFEFTLDYNPKAIDPFFEKSETWRFMFIDYIIFYCSRRNKRKP